jgi:hypothetical protein
MSITKKAIEEITAADLSALIGAAPDPARLAILPAWSRDEAAIAACSLANTDGGLVIAGLASDSAGRATAVTGSSASVADLLSAADALGAVGRLLARAATVDVGGKRVGLIAVTASAAPPVLVESAGTIYRRTAGGLSQALTRADLDSLLAKDRALRQQAERNVEGMLDRLAFGHFNYMTVAVVLASRVITDQPYRWAIDNRASLLKLGFLTDCGLSDANVDVRPGEVEVALGSDVTGFVRVSRNGSVAVGERSKRPAQDMYLSPAGLSQRLSAMAEAAAAVFSTTSQGPILGALFLEGVRDLRLPVDGGTTSPSKKDLVREFLPERFLHDAAQRLELATDVCRAAGPIFAADLVAGAATAGSTSAKAPSPQPQSWHGQTKRTERRLAGLRGHGSGR